MTSYDNEEVYPAKQLLDGKSTAANLEEYKKSWRQSIEQPEVFWSTKAKEHLEWFQEPLPGCAGAGTFIEGDINFFAGGKLNVSYNCIDRHLKTRGDQVAIIWEADEIGQGRKITYNEVARETAKIANLMKLKGVTKGKRSIFR